MTTTITRSNEPGHRTGCAGVKRLQTCCACAMRLRCRALQGLSERVAPAARAVLAELRGRHG